MAIEVKVPVLPESVSDATIATWNKKAGDAVARERRRLQRNVPACTRRREPAQRGLIKLVAHPVIERVDLRHRRIFRDSDSVGEIPQHTRGHAATAHAGNGRQARIVLLGRRDLGVVAVGRARRGGGAGLGLLQAGDGFLLAGQGAAKLREAVEAK